MKGRPAEREFRCRLGWSRRCEEAPGRAELSWRLAKEAQEGAAATQREEAIAKANRFRKKVKKPPLVSA